MAPHSHKLTASEFLVWTTNQLLQSMVFPINRKRRRGRRTDALRFATLLLFGGSPVTNTSAIRFPLKLANALITANPFEVEAALIVVRDLALRAPPYLMLMSQAAEDAIVAAGNRPDSSATVLAREAMSRFVKEMELHEYSEQHAARN